MKENKELLSVRIAPALIKRLDLWRDAQVVPPGRAGVVEVALKSFLDGQGAPEVREEAPAKGAKKRHDD